MIWLDDFHDPFYWNPIDAYRAKAEDCGRVVDQGRRLHMVERFRPRPTAWDVSRPAFPVMTRSPRWPPRRMMFSVSGYLPWRVRQKRKG